MFTEDQLSTHAKAFGEWAIQNLHKLNNLPIEEIYDRFLQKDYTIDPD